jgi:hypothetical protein
METLTTDGIDPKELDVKCDELCRMYAKRFYTQRDAHDYLMDKYRSGLIKQIGYGLLPVKVIGKGRDWKIVLA